MAALNLVPNLPVLAVQAGIFLVNCVVIKKLIVDPYTQLRDKRESLTVGSKDEATRLLGDCERIAANVSSRLGAASESAKKDRETVRGIALEKRQALLASAEREAKQHIENVESQVKDELAAERAKVPSIIAALTEEAYRVAVQ